VENTQLEAAAVETNNLLADAEASHVMDTLPVIVASCSEPAEGFQGTNILLVVIVARDDQSFVEV